MRGMPVLERAKAAARASGWKMDDTYTYSHTTDYGDKSHLWRSVSDVPDTIFYHFQGISPSPREQFVEIGYEESTRKWTVSAMGSDKDFIIRDAYPKVLKDDVLSDYWHIQDASLEALKPGPLRNLANELAGYLKQQIVVDEKARREEADRQSATSAMADQQRLVNSGDSRGGWVIGVLCAGVILSIAGGLLVWKSGRWFVSSPKTSVPTTKVQKPHEGRRYCYACSGCGARYSIPHTVLGKRFRCGKCKMTCSVPMDAEHLPAR
jgi:hypothetical protein